MLIMLNWQHDLVLGLVGSPHRAATGKGREEVGS